MNIPLKVEYWKPGNNIKIELLISIIHNIDTIQINYYFLSVGLCL